MKRKKREVLAGWIFLLPDLVGLSIFVILPAILGFNISLYNWSGLGKMKFAGFSNYTKMLTDPIFLKSLKVTIEYVFMFVPLNFLLSLSLALLIKKPSKGITFFRTVYFAPAAISLVSIAFVWSYIFQQNGFFNSILSIFGISPQPLLGSMGQALYIVLALSLYSSIGYFMVIFLAGLNDIPEEYYDAARVDGASYWQTFWHITFPLLKPTSFFVLIISLIQGFQLFDQVYVLTGGGPFYATSTVVFYAFQTAFEYYQFGYAAAMDFLMFIILVILSLILYKILKGGEVK
ncbi:carbohydrate ABC transporter permease [Athalassotoga saccharophila]|uniref:carbohydrate ABC transporter permease n=1 Tax=Athalassotoga saccharophila TaxID=1441386 RepID=UPI00137A5A11|nr:sugar ABC transporter permease [Athalassotoga saccharophila]BBJ27500.1 lactose transport system permease protein LacF [Athalassotoga saccharophila]